MGSGDVQADDPSDLAVVTNDKTGTPVDGMGVQGDARVPGKQRQQAAGDLLSAVDGTDEGEPPRVR